MYSIDCMKKIKTIIPLIITFCMNAVVYWGVPLLRTGIKTHNLSGPADEVIPFMPQFIIIYFGCYLFWVVNYFMASMREEKVKYQLFTADHEYEAGSDRDGYLDAGSTVSVYS